MIFLDRRWKNDHGLLQTGQERVLSMAVCSVLSKSMRIRRYLVVNRLVGAWQERHREGLLVVLTMRNTSIDLDELRVCLLLELTLSIALRRVLHQHRYSICRLQRHKAKPHGEPEPQLDSLF
jgi:hypothetical protein